MKVSVSKIANLPTIWGEFKVKVYKDETNQKEHIVIFTKNINEISAPMIRIHSECLTGDVLGSQKCDCANQLHMALEMIEQNAGMILYLRQEGRGIGLLNKINAYVLQEGGLNTVEANHQLGFEDDERDYSIVKYILNDFKINKVKLITNNPLKLNTVTQYGVKVVQRVPIITQSNKFNKEYLKTKQDLMGHLFQ